jgi:hypothetical protein
MKFGDKGGGLVDFFFEIHAVNIKKCGSTALTMTSAGLGFARPAIWDAVSAQYLRRHCTEADFCPF